MENKQPVPPDATSDLKARYGKLKEVLVNYRNNPLNHASILADSLKQLNQLPEQIAQKKEALDAYFTLVTTSLLIKFELFENLVTEIETISGKDTLSKNDSDSSNTELSYSLLEMIARTRKVDFKSIWNALVNTCESLKNQSDILTDWSEGEYNLARLMLTNELKHELIPTLLELSLVTSNDQVNSNDQDSNNNPNKLTMYLNNQDKTFFLDGMTAPQQLSDDFDFTNIQTKLTDIYFKKNVLDNISKAGHALVSDDEVVIALRSLIDKMDEMASQNPLKNLLYILINQAMTAHKNRSITDQDLMNICNNTLFLLNDSKNYKQYIQLTTYLYENSHSPTTKNLVWSMLFFATAMLVLTLALTSSSLGVPLLFLGALSVGMGVKYAAHATKGFFSTPHDAQKKQDLENIKDAANNAKPQSIS